MRDRIRELINSFDRLSAREQTTLLVSALALTLMFLFVGGYLIRKDLRSREMRIAVKSEKLVEIGKLRSDYRKRVRQQEQLAEKVKGNEELRILSYLEDLSKKSSIDLGNAAERPGERTGSDLVVEEAAEVMVKNVSLDRLYDFLTRIEEGNQLVKVRRLKIKTRFDNPEMLDASITVGTFKPKEAS